MMFRAWLAFFAVAWPATLPAGQHTPPPPLHPDHSRVADHDYVRLEDWARTADFRPRWLDRDKVMELASTQANLVFYTDPRQDSRKAELNGVSVWLALPVVFQDAHPCVSRLDISETLTPLLSPPLNPPGARIRTICLDPGHGGKDPGFVVGPYQEKIFTLLLAREVRSQLERQGFKVVMTRDSDSFVDKDLRPVIARKRGADLFVSLHFNAVDDNRSSVQGVQVFSCTPAGAASSNAGGEGDTRWVEGNRRGASSIVLAYQVQKSFLRELSIEDHGAKRARFAVLRDATMPAILIEGGFLSHPVEGKKIADPDYRRRMARAVVDGILAYQRAVKG
jgi:N-acetylmuramoyl-L-alanine amidase